MKGVPPRQRIDAAVLAARGPEAEPGEDEDRSGGQSRGIASGWALERLPLDDKGRESTDAAGGAGGDSRQVSRSLGQISSVHLDIAVIDESKIRCSCLEDTSICTRLIFKQ